jgi:DNA recombination protein RmuC
VGNVTMAVLVAAIALIAAALGFVFAARQGRLRADEARAAGRRERDGEIAALDAASRALRERLDAESARVTRHENEHRSLLERHTVLHGERADLAARLEEQLRRTAQAQALLDEAQIKLGTVFENLANKALEDNNKRATEANRQQLGMLLDPLKEQLKEFRQTVVDTHAREQRERGALAEQITSLRQLNQQISQDAINLTRALKGESKTQGAWGEMILERVLEASGLMRGREYDVQSTYSDGDGGRPRPDVIVHLPEDKDLVIDAKVTLTAYERFCAASDDTVRAHELDQHVLAMRGHIKSLSERNYAGLEGVRTLDFVLMFVPVEAAFIEAVRADGELYDLALRKNIALVSPSTLLATLRTVQHLWSLEKRNVNAQEIGRQAASLYDKFVGMVGDLSQLGEQLKRVHKTYDSAVGKLVSGKDNLIRKTERLRELGVTPAKNLPADMRALALENADDASGLAAGVDTPVSDDDGLASTLDRPDQSVQ